MFVSIKTVINKLFQFSSLLVSAWVNVYIITSNNKKTDDDDDDDLCLLTCTSFCKSLKLKKCCIVSLEMLSWKILRNQIKVALLDFMSLTLSENSKLCYCFMLMFIVIQPRIVLFWMWVWLLELSECKFKITYQICVYIF